MATFGAEVAEGWLLYKTRSCARCEENLDTAPERSAHKATTTATESPGEGWQSRMESLKLCDSTRRMNLRRKPTIRSLRLEADLLKSREGDTYPTTGTEREGSTAGVRGGGTAPPFRCTLSSRRIFALLRKTRSRVAIAKPGACCCVRSNRPSR